MRYLIHYFEIDPLRGCVLFFLSKLVRHDNLLRRTRACCPRGFGEAAQTVPSPTRCDEERGAVRRQRTGRALIGVQNHRFAGFDIASEAFRCGQFYA